MRIIYTLILSIVFLLSSSILDAADDDAALETAYYNQGKIYEKKKDYPAALDNYFEALAYSSELEKNKSGYIYLSISEVFSILNRRELAKKYMKMALDYTINQKDEDLKVSTLNAYSKLYYEDEDYSNALKFVDLAIKTEKRRKKYICGVSSLYQKARTLSKMGAKKKAAELLKSAVDMGLKLKNYNGLLPIMNDHIEQLIDSNNLNEAKKYLDTIDRIYAPYYPYYFYYYYLTAIYYEKKGDMNNALKFYRKTAGALDQYNTFSENTENIYSRMIEFYLKLYDKKNNILYLKKAVYFSEVKNSYIYELVTLKNKKYANFLEEKKKLEQDYIDYNRKYIRLLQNSPGSESLRSYENKLEALKRQNDEMMQFIQETPLSYKKYYFNDFNLSLTREKLTRGKIIIKYVVLNENIYAFRIDNRSISYTRLDEPASLVTGKIKQLTKPLDDFTKGRVDYLRIDYNIPLANRLYDILLKGILDPVDEGSEMIIIPDRELFRVPFEALVTGYSQTYMASDILFSEYEAAGYLIEKRPVSYALSLFHILKDAKPLSGKKYEIAAFGAPVIKNPFFFKELPSTEREIQDISRIYGAKKSRVFIKEEFNRNTFETYAPRSDIIHIATHFINNAQNPLYSALLFSSWEKGVPFYYADEILKLNLNAGLVVLSACESSESHLLGMQGLRGMTASFMHSGAQSMIVSMWPVDQYSSALIPLFYMEYRKKAEGKVSEALRTAKLSLMKQSVALGNGLKISFAHPFIWANFIHYRFCL